MKSFGELHCKELNYLATDMLKETLGIIFPGPPSSPISFPHTERENRRYCLISHSEHQSGQLNPKSSTDGVSSQCILLFVIATVSDTRSKCYLTLR